jgi:hypothetical protein
MHSLRLVVLYYLEPQRSFVKSASVNLLILGCRLHYKERVLYTFLYIILRIIIRLILLLVALFLIITDRLNIL